MAHQEPEDDGRWLGCIVWLSVAAAVALAVIALLPLIGGSR